MKRWLIVLSLASAPAAADPVWIGKFPESGDIPAPWQVAQPTNNYPPTRYTLRQWDGVAAVEAHAVKSMALLARPVDIDLTKTPVLCWRWRIDAALQNADMTTKAGDDYAARIYLSFSVPPETLGFGTRIALAAARALRGPQVPDAAINYVWDNKQPVGRIQASTYTDRSMMWVLRTGAGDAGRWVSERRPVSADFRTAFGYAPLRLTGVAVATDTDNTGEEARAGFAEFRFVRDDEPCD